MIYKILLTTRKAFTPLKNNRLKLSVISEFSNMVYGKKNESPETPEINGKHCKAKITGC